VEVDEALDEARSTSGSVRGTRSIMSAERYSRTEALQGRRGSTFSLRST
jgi:hypothetical protein